MKFYYDTAAPECVVGCSTEKQSSSA